MAEILLLGEDRERVAGIRSLLREDGHVVRWHPSTRTWREVEREVLPELVVAPVRSADPVLAAPGRPVRGFPPPLLLVQSGADLLGELRSEERIVDRIESPFGAGEFLGRVDALIRMRRVILWGRPDRRGVAPAGEPSGERGRRWRGLGGRIAGLLGARVPRYEKPVAPYLEVASRAAEWADGRDAFEPGHAERVTSLSAMIADVLDLPDGEATVLLRAAMLHDVGKVAMPVEILRQRGPLDAEQTRLIRTHPERGAALMRALDRDEEVARAILYHHERTDGNGYYGKPGDEVPRSARILAVAESYDAMTTSRVRDTLQPPAALDAIVSERGRQFDAPCVDALCDAIRPRRPGIVLWGQAGS